MRRSLFAALLFSAACSAAYADQPAQFSPGAPPGARIALDIAPARIRAPYDIQVLRESGEVLPTFGQRDRYYVEGAIGERYTIRVTNPTPRRVEAVVSVDGLDVIDGENGDLRKRGYVIGPYGETRIEGFRTSTDNVATFRFSSVGGSYAGMKGKARNVGVIAVAIFEEEAPPPEPVLAEPVERYRFKDDVDDDAADYDSAPSAQKSAPRTASATPTAPPPAPARASHPSHHAPAPRKLAEADSPSGNAEGGGAYDPAPAVEPRDEAPDERLGLGTEFGEGRYSAVSYTSFVRAGDRPIAIAELRYNDSAGLQAMGIPAHPLTPGPRELWTRETANPFPGDRFAQPPE
ncbi:MAG TPA: hypothetical protein VGM88_03090 [Kofleriaceae bacterium]|jgi:hypothetical protein